MSFTPILVSSALEGRLRARAAAAGVSVETYLERIAREDQEAEEELESLALEGLHSGDPIDVGSGYWEGLPSRGLPSQWFNFTLMRNHPDRC